MEPGATVRSRSCSSEFTLLDAATILVKLARWTLAVKHHIDYDFLLFEVLHSPYELEHGPNDTVLLDIALIPLQVPLYHPGRVDADAVPLSNITDALR